MVTEFGMSEKMGPVTYGDKDELVFLGKELSTEKNYSGETANLIDQEVKKFISGAFKIAKNILTQKLQILHKIAKELIRKIQAAKFVREHGEVCPASWTPGKETLKPGLDLVGKI